MQLKKVMYGIVIATAFTSSVTQPITARTCAIVVGSLAAGYLIGKGVTYLIHDKATTRYKNLCGLLNNKKSSESEIKKALATEILLDNETYYDAASPYRNYPLAHYKNNLDWYINALTFGKFFALGTRLNSALDGTIAQLNIIKRYIILDKRYIAERRAAQERAENRHDNAQIIVRHRL